MPSGSLVKASCLRPEGTPEPEPFAQPGTHRLLAGRPWSCCTCTRAAAGLHTPLARLHARPDVWCASGGAAEPVKVEPALDTALQPQPDAGAPLAIKQEPEPAQPTSDGPLAAALAAELEGGAPAPAGGSLRDAGGAVTASMTGAPAENGHVPLQAAAPVLGSPQQAEQRLALGQKRGVLEQAASGAAKRVKLEPA